MLRLTNDDVIRHLTDLCSVIDDDEIDIDTVVCLSPSSSIIGVMLSRYFDVPLVTVNFDNTDEDESNCWLPEEAAGGKQLLVVTVTNNNELLSSLCRDWTSSMGGKTKWMDNVTFASLIEFDKQFESDYYGMSVEDSTHGVEDVSFPWDEWWK